MGFGIVVLISEKVTQLVNVFLIALNFLFLVIRMSPTFLYREGTFHMGDLFPAFSRIEEAQNVFSHNYFLSNLYPR